MKELADIYIMKKQEWPDGIKIVPVNREVTSREREAFSKEVFNLSPQQTADYWNRLRFQGKLPPSVQTSDQAVLNFVRTIPGAIGYVSVQALPKDVKVLRELQ
jgi:ABC-type phosphate transport system substrate-binding protein